MKVIKTLIVVDVQKDFCRFYTPDYLKDLKEALNAYDKIVIVVDDNFETLIPCWLQEKGDILIRKSYSGVDIDEYLEEGRLEEKAEGVWEILPDGLLLLEVPNGHENFIVPKEMQDEFNKLIADEIDLVGGAENECLEDIQVALDYLGVAYHTISRLTFNGQSTYKNYYEEEEYWVEAK